MYILAQLIILLQLFSFILSDDARLPWRDSGIAIGFGMGCGYLNPAQITNGTSVFLALMGVAAVWFALIMIVFFYVSFSVLMDWPQNGLVLRIFRNGMALTTSVFFFPLIGMLFRSMQCFPGHDGWLNVGIECNSSIRIAVSVVLGVVIAVVVREFA